MNKIKKISKKKAIIIGVLLVIGIFIMMVYLFFYSGQVQGYKYILAYNQEKFEKAFKYYHLDTIDRRFEEREIVAFLSQQKQIDGEMIVDKSNISLMIKDLFKKKKEINMLIKYEKDKEEKEEIITIIRNHKGKRWSVKFPYELQVVEVFAPTGSKVYIDQEKLAQEETSGKVEIRNLLPGKHQITIQYYADMYPPFTKEISLPKESKVDSPYPTYDIAIFAPYHTWVTLGNVTKYNAGPSVVFENMLPGQYNVSIQMKDRKLEIFSQTIEVDQAYTSIHLEKIAGNEEVKKDLKEFFHVFNIEYEKGIKEGDSNFLHMFATEKINENLISDYKMWYIDQKDIKDAKSTMEIRDVYILSGKELKASILEEVYLMNLEQEYKVVIEWNYKLLKNDGKWKIAAREILQSIVAYKNEAGKWISY